LRGTGGGVVQTKREVHRSAVTVRLTLKPASGLRGTGGGVVQTKREVHRNVTVRVRDAQRSAGRIMLLQVAVAGADIESRLFTPVLFMYHRRLCCVPRLCVCECRKRQVFHAHTHTTRTTPHNKNNTTNDHTKLTVYCICVIIMESIFMCAIK